MKSLKGLNSARKVDWEALSNLSFSQLAENGLHAKTIAEACGLTVGQVHYRCKQIGMSLRDYRDGLTPTAELIISRYSIESMNQMTANSLRRKVLPLLLVRLEEVKERSVKAG
jgi:hypothetical protein